MDIGKVQPREITEEMKESYLSYAMSVIISRALPDVRDGLKPVHRRILYVMYEDGLTHAAKFRKSATVVGSALGRYHPHGDQAVYDALVRMAQDFSLRYPLIEGQGNFGCFTGETQVRLCDGRNLSFKDLIREQKQGKQHWTFSFNSDTQKIEMTEIKNPRLTRKNERLMEVVLDNGGKIKCTLDHQFMLRDGSYKKAIDLKPVDSLMPFYSKLYQESDKNLRDALNYFNNFSEILAKSREYNHKVVRTRILRKKEDVYDLTTEPCHNFLLGAGVFVHNSIDNDPAAAQRYTEARLTRIAEETLKDIEKETVAWTDNYDGTRKEPQVLPSKIPQLILNGTLGIAVGMATNIPPHNLKEICDALIHLVDHKDATTKDIFQFIKGPDFPTGGNIYNKREIIEAYSQGKGPFIMRGEANIIENPKTKRAPRQIIISEIPYQVNKAQLIEKMAELVKEKKVEGIKSIRDESNKEGMRIVVDLGGNAYPQKILNKFYKFTDLQKAFHLNMLALVDGIQPQVLSLRDLLWEWILHRKEVIRKRTQFDLDRARERAHILDGLKRALSHIDAIIKLIKASPTKEEAHKRLRLKLKFTHLQASAILDMRLQTLVGLEGKKITDELEEKLKLIKELSLILKSPQRILGVMKNELIEIKENYGDERKTKVFAGKVGEIQEIDLIPQEETIITITHGGYIKRTPPSAFRIQRRGGKGIVGMVTKGEDIVSHFLIALTHNRLLFFTNSGKVFQTPVWEIPEGARISRGRALVNFLDLGPEERVNALISTPKEETAKFLVMATKNGIIKKTLLINFEEVRRTGIIAIKLDKNDLLEWVAKSSGEDEVILVSQLGQAIRFSERDIRAMGRVSRGIKGIRLKGKDKVASMGIIKKTKDPRSISSLRGRQKPTFVPSSGRGKIKNYLLVITEKGFGKKTDIQQFKKQRRGGSGIKAAKVTEKTGKIISAKIISQEEELISISQKGHVIRVGLASIPALGRATQGVRIMKLENGDKVASITCL